MMPRYMDETTLKDCFEIGGMITPILSKMQDCDPMLDRMVGYSTIVGWIARNTHRLTPMYEGRQYLVDVCKDPLGTTVRDGWWCAHHTQRVTPYLEVISINHPPLLLQILLPGTVNAYPDEVIEARMRLKGRVA